MSLIIFYILFLQDRVYDVSRLVSIVETNYTHALLIAKLMKIIVIVCPKNADEMANSVDLDLY